MSIELVEKEIEKFLTCEIPEVISLNGKWGVGKTYTWNIWLKKYTDKIALDKYGYVSLFGLNSLDALKVSIAQSCQNKSLIGKEFNFETISDNKMSAIWQFIKKHADKIPGFKGHSSALAEIAFKLSSRSIICIDDFERRGDSLKAKDVLGLISNLRDQMNCKIILILNEDEVLNLNSESDENPENTTESEAIDFKKYFEKAIDRALTFSPTPEEAVRFALLESDLSAESKEPFRKNCIQLRIDNIRIIKKIELIILMIEPILKASHQKIKHQAIHTLTILGFSKYSSGIESVPSYEYIKNYSNLSNQVVELLGSDTTNKKTEWGNLIRDYGFTQFDEFDDKLANVFDVGYFVEDQIVENTRIVEKRISAAEQNNSFEESWGLYHDTFDNNKDEVIDAIFNSFKINYQNISKTNVNGTLSLFRELGEEEKADELLKFYMDNFKAELKFFDLEADTFGDSVTDSKFKIALNDKFNSFEKDEENIGERLLRIHRNNYSFGPRDLEILDKLTIADFFNLFKKKNQKDVHKLVRTARRLGEGASQLNSDRKYCILEKVDAALKKIASEDEINKRRVAQRYNIEVD